MCGSLHAISMPAIIPGGNHPMSRYYKSGVQAKGNAGKNDELGGGIKNHLCHQNNNPLFPKDQNKMPTPNNADQLESYLEGYNEKKKTILIPRFS